MLATTGPDMARPEQSGLCIQRHPSHPHFCEQNKNLIIAAPPIGCVPRFLVFAASPVGCALQCYCSSPALGRLLHLFSHLRRTAMRHRTFLSPNLLFLRQTLRTDYLACAGSRASLFPQSFLLAVHVCCSPDRESSCSSWAIRVRQSPTSTIGYISSSSACHAIQTHPAFQLSGSIQPTSLQPASNDHPAVVCGWFSLTTPTVTVGLLVGTVSSARQARRLGLLTTLGFKASAALPGPLPFYRAPVCPVHRAHSAVSSRSLSLICPKPGSGPFSWGSAVTLLSHRLFTSSSCLCTFLIINKMYSFARCCRYDRARLGRHVDHAAACSQRQRNRKLVPRALR